MIDDVGERRRQGDDDDDGKRGERRSLFCRHCCSHQAAWEKMPTTTMGGEEAIEKERGHSCECAMAVMVLWDHIQIHFQAA